MITQYQYYGIAVTEIRLDTFSSISSSVMDLLQLKNIVVHLVM